MEVTKELVEKRLWTALEMDEFGRSLVECDNNATFMFGTGHTVNSCRQCDNSLRACTAGEAGCNPKLLRKVPNVKELRMS